MLDQLLDKKAIIKGFNRASASYDNSAILQQEVAIRLLERLQWIKIEPKIIVDLGGGTGDISQQLALKYPNAKIYIVDIAEQMLKTAKAKHSRYSQNSGLLNKIKNTFLKSAASQINYICGDAEQIPLISNKCDLIVSNLAIQWCEQTQLLFNELQRILSPSGCLLFSTFGVDTLRELKQSWSAVSENAHVNDFKDMHDLGDAMLLSGLDNPVMDCETIVIEYTKLVDLFKDLKQIGAQNHLHQRQKGLTPITKFKAMQAMYEQFKQPNGKYPASYEVVYGHAWGKDLNLRFKKMKQRSKVQPIKFVASAKKVN